MKNNRTPQKKITKLYKYGKENNNCDKTQYEKK